MSNQIQFNAFNFKSSQVRVIVDPNQEPWFCGTDVCDILGYTNAPKALKDHCKEAGITKRYISYSSGKKEAIFINEPNLYRLIIKSRKPEAEPFEAWVFEEVLPQIRKTGQYQVKPQQLALPEPEPKYPFELTALEIHRLVWLWFSHAQMNGTLGLLVKPLEAIRSSYAPTVYSDHFEYKRHYKEALPIMQRFVSALKTSNPTEWQQLEYRLNNL